MNRRNNFLSLSGSYTTPKCTFPASASATKTTCSRTHCTSRTGSSVPGRSSCLWSHWGPDGSQICLGSKVPLPALNVRSVEAMFLELLSRLLPLFAQLLCAYANQELVFLYNIEIYLRRPNFEFTHLPLNINKNYYYQAHLCKFNQAIIILFKLILHP